MNKRLVIGIPVVLVLIILGSWGYQNFLAPEPPTPTPDPDGTSGGSPLLISAEGRVVPAQYVTLSFNTGGTVQEVLVEKGDEIEAGTEIARLDNYTQFQAAVTAAELEMTAAQQDYDDLFTYLDQTRAQAEQEVANARDAVRDAERRVNNLENGAKQTEIDQAESTVILLRDQLEQAQEDFDKVAGKPETNLQRAAAQNKLAQIQQLYDDAIQRLNNLLGAANEIDLAQAEADLEAAKAWLADAEQQVVDLQEGPDPEDLDLAEKRLANAQAQLTAAQDNLAKQELRAPFAGTVVQMNLKVGEFVSPALPQVVLADFSTWKVETTDLAEVDVALLSVGQTATITLDAFPGLTFEGVIEEIGLQGQDVRGQVTYPVTVTFDPGDVAVRWEMTAFVDVEVSEQ
jgi:multidrug resistance efflux pump